MAPIGRSQTGKRSRLSLSAIYVVSTRFWYQAASSAPPSCSSDSHRHAGRDVPSPCLFRSRQVTGVTLAEAKFDTAWWTLPSARGLVLAVGGQENRGRIRLYEVSTRRALAGLSIRSGDILMDTLARVTTANGHLLLIGVGRQSAIRIWCPDTADVPRFPRRRAHPGSALALEQPALIARPPHCRTGSGQRGGVALESEGLRCGN